MDRLIAAALLTVIFAAHSAAQAQPKMAPGRNTDVRVVCESTGFGRQSCAANLRGYAFASVRALSSARCDIGRNFGYDDGGVWVDQGCRGEFLFTYRGDQGGGYAGGPVAGDAAGDLQVRCESRDNRRAACVADLRGYYLRDVRQISRTQCVEGQNFGFDDRGVWAQGGCRADFIFTRRYSGSANDFRTIECGSRDGRRAECPFDLRGYTLANLKQRSRSACTLGTSFGYDERGVWVDQGCRAEFSFGFRGRGYGRPGYGQGGYPPGQTGYPTGQGGYPAAEVTTTRCESVDNRRVYCELPRDARVRSVRLGKQLSRAACTEGQTWGVDQRGLWVDDGCRADFEISR